MAERLSPGERRLPAPPAKSPAPRPAAPIPATVGAAPQEVLALPAPLPIVDRSALVTCLTADTYTNLPPAVSLPTRQGGGSPPDEAASARAIDAAFAAASTGGLAAWDSVRSTHGVAEELASLLRPLDDGVLADVARAWAKGNSEEGWWN
jgi:hypothetical protein